LNLGAIFSQFGWKGGYLGQLIRKLIVRLGSPAHEGRPNLSRKAAACHAFHGREVVVTNPHPNHQVSREANTPCISVFLARPGFSVGGDRKTRPSA
jgi:hypothetical protein